MDVGHHARTGDHLAAHPDDLIAAIPGPTAGAETDKTSSKQTILLKKAFVWTHLELEEAWACTQVFSM